jgi:hypothetical protein
MYFTNKTIKIAVRKWFMNPVAEKVKYGHISQWKTSKVTNMDALFARKYHWYDYS